MRMYWMGAFALLSIGCAAQKTQPVARQYAPSNAGALAFDPPATIGVDLPDLDRNDRATSAFYGYESLTSQSVWQYQDDEQYVRGAGGPVYRHAITVKSGVAYR